MVPILPWNARVSLVGPVGCGKTTVLCRGPGCMVGPLVPRLLMGLHVPDAGDAYFHGKWYSEWPSLQPVRHALGYIPQNPVLFDRTLLENVLYGQPQTTRAAAQERAMVLLTEL